MQTSNLTYRHERQINFGKAVLVIASVKAKEVHDIINFCFGMHHICFYPNPQNKIGKLTDKNHNFVPPKNWRY
ncbi:MAG: hypothetical protein WC599_09830 [Bacteroidales bacterium]